MFLYLVTKSAIQREIVECSKKALFCGDCCDRNQAIILVVLVLISLSYFYSKVLEFLYLTSERI